MKRITKRKPGIIIQARTESTRLPGKILMRIGEEPLIIYLYNRIKNQLDLPIIIATTQNPKDDELANFLISRDITIYRGEAANVVGRII